MMDQIIYPRKISDSKASNRRRISYYKGFKRLVIVISILVLALYLIIQTVNCLRKYFSYPTYLSTSILTQDKSEIPAITFCPDVSGKYHADVLADNGIMSTGDYNYHKNGIPTWQSNDTETTNPKQLFDQATWNASQLFKLIVVRHLYADANGDYTIYEPLNETNTHLTENRHRSFGSCFSWHPGSNEFGIYYLKFRFNTNIKLYLHHDGSFLNLNGRMGHKIPLGQTMQAQVNFQDIKLLPKDLGNGKMSCIDTQYDDCMYSALEKYMKEAAGCVSPWIVNSDLPICTEESAINETYWIQWTRVTNQQKDCPSPCERLEIGVSGKNTYASSEDYSQMYLYFPPTAMLSEEHWLYTELSLFAEIGGYMGLLMGYSILNVAYLFGEVIDKKIAKLEKEEV